MIGEVTMANIFKTLLTPAINYVTNVIDEQLRKHISPHFLGNGTEMSGIDPDWKGTVRSYEDIQHDVAQDGVLGQKISTVDKAFTTDQISASTQKPPEQKDESKGILTSRIKSPGVGNVGRMVAKIEEDMSNSASRKKPCYPKPNKAKQS
jgi:hypothetical protein